MVKCHSHEDGSWSDLAEVCVCVCVCVMRLKRILVAGEWNAALQQFSVTSQEGWVTGSSVRLQSSHTETLWEEWDGNLEFCLLRLFYWALVTLWRKWERMNDAMNCKMAFYLLESFSQFIPTHPNLSLQLIISFISAARPDLIVGYSAQSVWESMEVCCDCRLMHK